MPIPDDVAIGRLLGVLSDAPESETVLNNESTVIPGHITRPIRLLLGLALTLGGLMNGPAVFAQVHPLFIDSPAGSEVGADGADAPEIAPLESTLTAPEPVSNRLFGVIPNYRAAEKLDTYKPLTTAEKYHIAFEDSFDWPNFFLLAGYAAQSQVAAGGFHHNGGLPVFGEYYARAFSDQIIGSYVTDAIMPSLLHEDPRYFRLGTGTFWRRTYYAASRIFVTRLDNGKSRFNITEIAGNMGVIAITTLYYPDSQTPSKGAERFGMQLGNDAVSNILTEFWPDIKHRLRPLQHRLFPR
jgi:hypothetical protein